MISFTLLPVLLSFSVGSATPSVGYNNSITCSVNVNYTDYIADDNGWAYEYNANFGIIIDFNSISDYYVYSNSVDLTITERTPGSVETVREQYLAFVDEPIGVNTEFNFYATYVDNSNNIILSLDMPVEAVEHTFTGFSMLFSDSYYYFNYDPEIVWYNFYNNIPSLIARYYNDNGGSYQNGYDQGYQDGLVTGNEQGNQAGYNQGYADGYHDGAEEDETAVVIFTGILNVALLPVNVFLQILNFEVFGINIAGFVSAVLTIAIIVIIVRIVTGKKSGE